VTFDEWKQVVAIAATLWRGREAPLDPAQLGQWYRVEFRRQSVTDVDAAFNALARSQEFFPSLAELRQATCEAAGARRNAEEQAARGNMLHLTPLPAGTADLRVRLFDQAADQWRQETKAELCRFAQRHGMDDATLQARLAQLDQPGSFARRARKGAAEDRDDDRPSAQSA
jgi:hypothetical protein